MKKTTQKEKKSSSATPLPPTSSLDTEWPPKLDKFDSRGVQTLFRTLSRNHYNLLSMSDSKASIVLTINSIIISIIMGSMYMTPESDRALIEISGKILLNTGLLSMVFALLSMLPHKYLGRTYKNSDYKGTLHAPNFSNQSLEEYRAEMHRVMKDGHNLYNEMIADMYFLGKAVTYKRRLLLISVAFFLLGLIASNIITFSIWILAV